MSRHKHHEETDKLTRIAIVNADRCKPKRCRQECKKSCPVVRMGKLCIEVTPNDKIATISEELCIGCGICVKAKSKERSVARANDREYDVTYSFTTIMNTGKKKTSQVRVGLAHEGFRTIIHKNGKKIMSVVWEPS